jgi:hypothetical protein
MDQETPPRRRGGRPRGQRQHTVEVTLFTAERDEIADYLARHPGKMAALFRNAVLHHVRTAELTSTEGSRQEVTAA